MKEVKFLKFKTLGKERFYFEPEVIHTSLDLIVSDIKENFAKYYFYKKFVDIEEDFNEHYKNTLKSIKDMSDKEMIKQAIDMNIFGVNIILPTIPSIMLCNVSGLDSIEDYDYIDVTEKILFKIKERANFEEIKEFVSTHTDAEIRDKYCSEEKFKDYFWDL